MIESAMAFVVGIFVVLLMLQKSCARPMASGLGQKRVDH